MEEKLGNDLVQEMKANSKIKIIFHFESLNTKTYGPVLYMFYYKTGSDIIFYKEIELDIASLRLSESSNIFEHMEKNWETYEKILHYNQYRCTRKDVDKTFNDSLLDIMKEDEDVSDALEEKKNELISLIRKNKIDNIIK
jgi:hypothetical protein